MKEREKREGVREVEITPALYASVVRHLAEAIDDKQWFSGTISIPHPEMECSLTSALIVYRNGTSPADITDIVPVWWEFSTKIDGVECLNDFSFRYLRSLFID